VKLGGTFLWSPDDASQGRREHLYIIVTDPNNNGGRFVAFNLTRSGGGQKALTLKVGDHPFIKRYDSDVNFGDGLIVSVADIQAEIERGRAIQKEPMDMRLVERIARFAIVHPAVSGDIEKMIAGEWHF
jgi:hypothetical protein